MAKSEDRKSVTNGAETSLPTSENGQARFEQERLTRREVFARFGFRAAAVAVAALTADDLMRKVGETMARHAGDNQVASEVAKEFKNAGVAFAHPSGQIPPNCTSSGVGNWCTEDGTQAKCIQCVNGTYGPGGYCEAQGDYITRNAALRVCDTHPF